MALIDGVCQILQRGLPEVSIKRAKQRTHVIFNVTDCMKYVKTHMIDANYADLDTTQLLLIAIDSPWIVLNRFNSWLRQLPRNWINSTHGSNGFLKNDSIQLMTPAQNMRLWIDLWFNWVVCSGLVWLYLYSNDISKAKSIWMATSSIKMTFYLAHDSRRFLEKETSTTHDWSVFPRNWFDKPMIQTAS